MSQIDFQRVQWISSWDSILLWIASLMRLMIFLILLILAACATRYSVPEHYARVETDPAPKATQSTVVYILVDGLSIESLKKEIAWHHLPEIERHFLGPGQKIHRAHSIFPSLTFPNISSLLKAQPVHETGFLGNNVIAGGRLLSFESALDRPQYSALMHGNNVFSHLTEQGRRSVSLDYGLGSDATVSSDLLDLKTGLALEFQDYLYLDQKRIDSLALLLMQNSFEQWPDFVFIHLVGNDFSSHHYGSQSPKTFEYLENLDQGLKKVFETLRRAEGQGHKVISILSADHGFLPGRLNFLNVESEIEKFNPNTNVLNEGRLASVYFKQQPSQQELERISRQLTQKPGIEITSFRLQNKISIFSGKGNLSFDLISTLQCPDHSMGVALPGQPAVCPRNLPAPVRDFFGPFFLENLAFYFQAEKRPDLLIIPNSKTSFLDNEVGFHGGPTAEETLIPLLLRNAQMKNPDEVPAQWEILRFLNSSSTNTSDSLSINQK